jgi:hypothetical protein
MASSRYERDVDVRRLPDNRTPMAVRCAVMDDPTGREMVVTIAKLSWRVSRDGEITLRVPPASPRLVAPRRAGPEHARSLAFPDDGVQQRPGTDVVMLGTAQPPAAGSVNVVDVVLRVGDGSTLRIDKTIRVHGPRVWDHGMIGPSPGPAAPLSPTPLIWENAYGGVDESDPARGPLRDDRNPVGSGVARQSKSLAGLPVPPLEDPRQPLSSRSPAPAGFGPIPSDWMPLSQYAGTHDETWRNERAPIRPLDYDLRHAGCAPSDQHCDPPLLGNEGFEVHGVLVDRIWRFQLPLYRPIFRAHRRDEDEARMLETHLDTVFIDADEGVVELTWRASVPLPIVPQQLRSITVGSTDVLPDRVQAQVVAAGRAALETPS